MTDIISDHDVERAIHVYNEMDAVIGDLIHNKNLTEALVQVAEARIADAISEGYQKMPIDKIKWKARASKEFTDALKAAARADGELGAARLRIRAAENVIEIWRTQQANNRRAHL
jgi:hypothetical protein